MLKIGILGIFLLTAACATIGAPSQTSSKQVERPIPEGAKALVVGGGCFWCVETIFEQLKGVVSVESGYAGGDKPNPTYEQVCTGRTGHAEVVKVVHNPKEVSADDLLHIFFTTHDPTTLNRQGMDVGTQYRSVIFYETAEEKALAEKIIKEIDGEKIFSKKIVTTVEPLKNYSRAEDYHQDYYAKYEKATPDERAKMNAGYCSAVIEPKVKKFREKYAAKLRKDRAP